ncbi:MAG: thioredoxin family protein [Candidatus Bathyarchaeota archaeon]|nr:thioredoxin family protein [Candidatus Bathyarchaeota archaeon]
MSEKPTYYDNRSEFWKQHWTMAQDYDTFLKESDQSQAKRWYDSAERVTELTPEQAERLKGYNRELNILVYAGVWCGDCSRQGPLLKKLADVAGDKVNIKIIDREASQELKDELRIMGASRVPIVVFLTEDFWEIGRFGERLLTVYRAKAAREVGRGDPAGILSPQARNSELEEWLDIFERMLIMVRIAPPLRQRYND